MALIENTKLNLLIKGKPAYTDNFSIYCPINSFASIQGNIYDPKGEVQPLDSISVTYNEKEIFKGTVEAIQPDFNSRQLTATFSGVSELALLSRTSGLIYGAHLVSSVYNISHINLSVLLNSIYAKARTLSGKMIENFTTLVLYLLDEAQKIHSQLKVPDTYDQKLLESTKALYDLLNKEFKEKGTTLFSSIKEVGTETTNITNKELYSKEVSDLLFNKEAQSIFDLLLGYCNKYSLILGSNGIKNYVCPLSPFSAFVYEIPLTSISHVYVASRPILNYTRCFLEATNPGIDAASALGTNLMGYYPPLEKAGELSQLEIQIKHIAVLQEKTNMFEYMQKNDKTLLDKVAKIKFLEAFFRNRAGTITCHYSPELVPGLVIKFSHPTNPELYYKGTITTVTHSFPGMTTTCSLNYPYSNTDTIYFDILNLENTLFPSFKPSDLISI